MKARPAALSPAAMPDKLENIVSCLATAINCTERVNKKHQAKDKVSHPNAAAVMGLEGIETTQAHAQGRTKHMDPGQRRGEVVLVVSNLLPTKLDSL
jgi:hypothetical protein